jgi:hypothetical protein
MVGTSGRLMERFVPVTARARTRPLRTCCAIELVLSNMSWTLPAMRSAIAGAPPLYGMCTISVPVMYLNSSPLTCPGEPLLEDALESFPGFFFA